MKQYRFSRRGGYATRIDKTVRSNFEANIKKNLLKEGVGFTYETLRIPYTTSHYYKPDFVLDNGIIVEAKGLFTSSDRSKHLTIKKQNPELDIRFLFQRNQKISKGSKTTYKAWCEKHGFKYAIGERVPKDWINEENRKGKETRKDG